MIVINSSALIATLRREPEADRFLHVIAAAHYSDHQNAPTPGHVDGLIFEAEHDQNQSSAAIRTGPVVDRAMHGMRHVIAAMAAQGNNLVVDDVMTKAGQDQEYRVLLSGLDVRLVGLFAPLDVLRSLGTAARGPADRPGTVAVRAGLPE